MKDFNDVIKLIAEEYRNCKERSAHYMRMQEKAVERGDCQFSDTCEMLAKSWSDKGNEVWRIMMKLADEDFDEVFSWVHDK